MQRLSLLVLLAVTLPACSRAQGAAPPKWADTLSADIDAATISNDLARLQAARALAARVLVAYPDDGLILHYHGYALYREGSILSTDGKDALPTLQQAASSLEKSLTKRALPETHVLLASLYGRFIAADPSRAMELGMAIQAEDNAAIATGPDNPRVWLIKGINAMFTPTEYGGGLPPAKHDLNNAVEFFAKDHPKPGQPRWGYAEAYAWLGQVYAKEGNKAQAASAYKKALEIAPNFTWAAELQRTLNAK